MSTNGEVVPKRKLIEVALPLETINRESAREKSIRHGHPSTLHLWWARRPLAAARAVLFAQLVDDPSSDPDRFPTEEAQRVERERLHKLIERLVVWENVRDQALLREAHEEILKSTGGDPPPILDPFAGGGTIPLEAQRLGLVAQASDLNPVAVLINKALIEIPPRFAGRPPVFPGRAEARIESWAGATGLAADVRAYGEWMRDEAKKRIGRHYPSAPGSAETEAQVIAWIWARTVMCPNPACGVEMPLAGSWWLGKKTGKEAWVQPIIVPDGAHPSGKRVEFEIRHGTGGAPTADEDGTVGRHGAKCVACGTAVPLDFVRTEGRHGRLGATLMAIVVQGNRQRIYLPPTPDHASAAHVARPSSAPEANLPDEALGFRVQNYGMTQWSDLFTARQLVALTTFSDLVVDARERIHADACSAGMLEGGELSAGGDGAAAYADAVATYLAFATSRLSSTNSSLCRWNSAPSKESVSDTFARHALSMIWDFAEGHPFCPGPCDLGWSVGWVARALEGVPAVGDGHVEQSDAASRTFDGALLSTDPPYYDNIGYSDLSDFFYVWLRRSLRPVHPVLLGTMLVPKADELVANPYRHEGREGAKRFFEDGFRAVFARARESARADYPITVYYAYKQAEASGDHSSSSGWETLLDGMIHTGWEITSTWPLRSERSGRMRDVASNALASSIVLSLRPRALDASTIDRRGFISALQTELPDALRKLQQGGIAPVDLGQAAIGPGMAVFSRYAKVIEDDGSPMSVGSAYQRIGEIVDQVLHEQEGDFDSSTRFAIAWYRLNGYRPGNFGDADNIARGRNTAVEALKRDGILTSVAGKVTLRSPESLPDEYDVVSDARLSAWEVLHHLIKSVQRNGLPAAGAFVSNVQERRDVDVDLVKELAFLLFSIAEKNGWAQDALAFNTVATAWPDVVEAARTSHAADGTQAAFDFEEN